MFSWDGASDCEKLIYRSLWIRISFRPRIGIDVGILDFILNLSQGRQAQNPNPMGGGLLDQILSQFPGSTGAGRKASNQFWEDYDEIALKQREWAEAQWKQMMEDAESLLIRNRRRAMQKKAFWAQLSGR
jgi:hypothetical protein